jgi:Kef-type K+ transport system membrane component KefB
MSNSDLTSILLVLLLLVGLAHLLGYLFVKLRQPRVVGEIVAGIVLGPALIGRLPFLSELMEAVEHQGNILNFVYWLGLLLLMFLSSAETRHLFAIDAIKQWNYKPDLLNQKPVEVETTVLIKFVISGGNAYTIIAFGSPKAISWR